MSRAVLIGWLLVLLSLQPAHAQQKFVADSAFAYLRHLSVTIGPRPIGSAGEQRALSFVVRKFQEFGADTAYVLPLEKFSTRGGRANTRSGVAVGLFRGESDSIIVIGGHLDSSGPEVPGANDDGSGTACVLELARIWAQQPRRYTLLFAGFGGEESGLIGSEHFVEHDPHMDRVALMLQIDMAGSDDDLIPFLEIKSHQAPEWLVRDLYATARQLGIRGLRYPTHFFSLNNAMGGAGSDHMPFLQKNIPALDLTAGVNSSPIHTPQDRIEFITPEMLARSGRLVNALLQRYQTRGIPAPRSGRYMLWQFGMRPLFLPLWMLWAVIAVALLGGVISFLVAWRRDKQFEEPRRVRVAALKILGMWATVPLAAQGGEALIGALRGLRYPWAAHPLAYFGYSLLWGAAAIWFWLWLRRNRSLRQSPWFYAKRALLFPMIFTVVMLAASPRLAVYPAFTLLLITAALWVPRSVWKLVLALLATLPMARLLFNEALPFFAHNLTMAGLGIQNFWSAAAMTGGLALFCWAALLPSLFAPVWLYREAAGFRRIVDAVADWRGGVVMAVLLLAGGVWCARLPAYNDRWRPQLNAAVICDTDSTKSLLRLRASEYMYEVAVRADTLVRENLGGISHWRHPIAYQAQRLETLGETAVQRSDSLWNLQFDWRLVSKNAPRMLSIALRSDSLKLELKEASWAYNAQAKEIRFRWFGEMPDTLRISGVLQADRPGAVRREIRATYVGLPAGVEVTAPRHDLLPRLLVIQRDTLWINQTGE